MMATAALAALLTPTAFDGDGWELGRDHGAEWAHDADGDTLLDVARTTTCTTYPATHPVALTLAAKGYGTGPAILDPAGDMYAAGFLASVRDAAAQLAGDIAANLH